jgi:hypothetical protein
VLTILTGTQQYAYISKQRINSFNCFLVQLEQGYCVFHVYMQQEDKAMVMTLYMTVVKEHSQHGMIPTITIYMTIVRPLTLTTKHKTV